MSEELNQKLMEVKEKLRAKQKIIHKIKVIEQGLAREKTRLRELGSFVTFADYFFDGLITDWIVQSRINNSLENAVNVGNKVLEIFKALQKALDNNQQELEILHKQKQEMVETAG